MQENLRHDQAAEYLNIASPTLANMRVSGKGPKFSRISRKLIIYRKEDLDLWLAAHLCNSTSDYAGK